MNSTGECYNMRGRGIGGQSRKRRKKDMLAFNLLLLH